ncbi:ABC transporter permease [Acidisphaera sp. L21]|jgi:putative spermidine/putrescine transport system permease protein|uniref:ABC transporter permease n=1 Tax=Acidisphaera sp. L21 TaxID=1641851 RepID=UPI00131B177C|nr:ABC transporter permease [Acidisphaera sp. L21]
MEGPGRGIRGTAWTVILFLLLPLAVVLPVSLTDQPYLSLPLHTLSLQYYANLLHSADWQSSILQSLLVACVSAGIAVILGTLCAIGCWRMGDHWAKAIQALMLIPIVVPTIVYALGLYRFYAQLGLLDTLLGIILAHAVTAIPYVVVIVSTGLSGVDARLEQAARSLGAGPIVAMRRVLLPLLRPAMLSGGLFAFVHSWDELVIVLFIAGRRVFTLPRRMWDGINDKLDPTLAAVAVLLVILSAALLFLDLWLRARREQT